MYDSEKMLWKEKERSRIRAAQMDNFRGFWVLGGWIDFQMHGVTKGWRKGLMKVFSSGSAM